MESYYHRIKQEYQKAGGDATALFQTILAIAAEIGLDQALACLERCVIEKRLTWLAENQEGLNQTGDPLLDGYHLFYERYLGVSAPADGSIVEHTDRKLVMRWWNDCPTLEMCRKFGVDTREICRKAYHQPVQAFLSQVNPKLRFERNYEAIRPHTAYCEEIITVEE
jgi:hypothetical protein